MSINFVNVHVCDVSWYSNLCVLVSKRKVKILLNYLLLHNKINHDNYAYFTKIGIKQL